MCWKVGSNTKHPFLKATGLAKSLHFTFHEVCTGADQLTLLDLLDHVREGYFSVVCLLPPDDSAGQQPTRTRSQPLGLDGLCPEATRIVRGTN